MFMHLRYENNSIFLYDNYSNTTTTSDRCSFAIWEIITSICPEYNNYNDNYYKYNGDKYNGDKYDNGDRIQNPILYIPNRDRGSWGTYSKPLLRYIYIQTIFAKKGDNLTIKFYNTEALEPHTFTLDAPYNINSDIKGGENSTINFVANNEGIFTY